MFHALCRGDALSSRWVNDGQARDIRCARESIGSENIRIEREARTFDFDHSSFEYRSLQAKPLGSVR